VAAPGFDEVYPEISPDGRWIACVSEESGNSEVYVRPFPDVGSGRFRVSTDGGFTPIWSRDGPELFYDDPSPSGRLMAARLPGIGSSTTGEAEFVLIQNFAERLREIVPEP